MTPKTLKALKGSIAKWERNARAETPEDYSISSGDCPLCDLFDSEFCNGCPVSEKAGKHACRGTPYDEACSAWAAWFRLHTTAKANAARKAAQAEVEFLKSLLPESETMTDKHATATETLRKQEEVGVKVKIFERMVAEFTDRYAPEDRYEAARFTAQLNNITRQLCIDIQEPVNKRHMELLTQLTNPMYVVSLAESEK